MINPIGYGTQVNSAVQIGGQSRRGRRLIAVITGVLCFVTGVAPWEHVRGATAEDILEETGVASGLMVHVGCGSGQVTAALRTGESCVVHGLATSPEDVAAARRYVGDQEVYGPVSIATWDGTRLPYVDNLVNLLVIGESAEVSRREALRVLAPYGVAYWVGEGGKKLVKPCPEAIDEWPQHLHGANNNAVSSDTAVGPPRHLQWTDYPTWSRSHMGIATVHATVSSQGRLFSIEDRATPEHPFLPGRFKLIARDAFNGIELWRRNIEVWEPITRYIKSTAIELQRRLVAVGDRVYFTPGLTAPLTVYDAKTGERIETYEESSQTREIVYDQGVLYLVLGDRVNAAIYDQVKPEEWRGINLGGFQPDAPFGGTGFRSAYSPQTRNRRSPRVRIRAVEVESGQTLWTKTEQETQGYVPASLAVHGERAAFATRSAIVCLDRASGEAQWDAEYPLQARKPLGTVSEAPIGVAPPTLVLDDSGLYIACGKKLLAYSLEDGAVRWEGEAGRNYQRGPDLFVVDDAVWTGPSVVNAYSAETGDPLKRIRQRMTGPMGHDRCYRNFITKRFYINSQTGGADFLQLSSGKEFPNHWTRGTCGMPVVPSNGMLYCGPWACQCSIGAMVPHTNAFYGEDKLERPDQDIPVARVARLEKGPAYQAATGVDTAHAKTDWPTYRHDANRGGVTDTTISSDLAPAWKVQVSSVPGQPVVAAGKVFLPDVDAHCIRAFEMEDGQEAWTFTAGGRVDSPPTYWKGLLLFGCRDGWVYCLQATNGELAWRFRDLPDKRLGAFGQLESAWPVSGNILVMDDIAYFSAGRSSFLDGGIFLYGLNPRTGAVVHSRRIHGPFQEKTGFPAVNNAGCRADVLVGDGELIYMRHKAFNPDLSDADSPRPHIIASAGFLEGAIHHRSYWTIKTGFRGKTQVKPPVADILVTDGKTSYGIQGFPVHRHSYFDPRVKGYRLAAVRWGDAAGSGKSGKQDGESKKNKEDGDSGTPPSGSEWEQHIPLAGRAMAAARDILLIAGHPAFFPPDHSVETYEAAYAGKLGGILWLASAADGSKLARYELNAPPVWDGVAVAKGKVFVALEDGSLVCYGAK
ncbi:MAG: PQQ-binding-like beta-propeller repeat protein [Planctomycetota bacterium]